MMATNDGGGNVRVDALLFKTMESKRDGDQTTALP